jgi:hypothetical protein
LIGTAGERDVPDVRSRYVGFGLDNLIGKVTIPEISGEMSLLEMATPKPGIMTNPAVRTLPETKDASL